MNPFAYQTTGLAIKAISNLSKANINLHNEDNIPRHESIIFAINHFTRIETFLMPYLISKLTDRPVWSLADYELFKGLLGSYLEKVGALSTRNVDRDRLIIKTLLTGESTWIIFPEGRMVKDKKVFYRGRFMIPNGSLKRPPHTGAATLAMRSEFYRQRISAMREKNPEEYERILSLFEIESGDNISNKSTYIVPVNITYYQIRARENILSKLATGLVDNIPERVVEEIMTEGTMLLSGVDIDIRFGKPIDVKNYLSHKIIQRDIQSAIPFDFDDPIASRKYIRHAAFRVMESFMSSIYNMTTVNHDHLFASVLRNTLYRKIDEAYLKRCVFMIASKLIKRPNIYLHKDLASDQTHLLTDDRFNNFRNFLKIALDTGVLERKNGHLIPNKKKMSAFHDFHKMRIENPVAVMANDIEPMLKLQKIIRRISRTPRFLIRRSLIKQLVAADLDDFNRDYHEFSNNNSKPMDIGKPCLIRGRSRKKGVLLIHGYMAAPAEVSLLASYLGRQGLWVYAPRLKGHGTSPEDLVLRSYNDWIESVEKGYAIISIACDQVIVGGFSTGGGLALNIVSRIHGIAGMFVINPPMKLQDFSSRFVPALDTWNRLMDKIQLESVTKHFIENKTEHPDINYFRNPISGIRELERLMDSVRPTLSEIKIPAFVGQAKDDPIVNPEGSKKLFDELGSKDKLYVPFDFQRHGILMGKGSEEVHRQIGEFIKKI